MSELFSVTGKVALVTGGTQGIGRMIAQGFVEAGARVYLTARTKSDCEDVAQELSAGGGECVAIPADLSDEQECVRLAREIADRESGLHILVNNAGTAWTAPVEQFPASAWDSVLDLGLKAPLFLVRELAPLLRAAGTAEDPARIVNIGSADALRVPEMPTYSAAAAKAAIHHITRMLAHDFAPTVTANVIAPGSFPSRMMAGVLDAMGEEIAAVTPLQRIGRPDDIVGTAIYLCSRAGSYVTGSVLAVDGGLATARTGFVPGRFLTDAQ
ncbi:NAD(P)-dependent dehydrogenase, short-chain alcohol dehydrogenase family [Micromonospora phaseoli]|uniref:NAD(P)-dependent dehydrogenase, short-chain alcohol dehydrogenase family n=1 Tax=Micromonospora phaseoli TaxID=1144548 RepID=A0A1H6YNN0_9ACTN|nr:SDR family oxidoreductase [Micromonospora phaseoli]PZW00128.1 NAD(P)-dependent dehydrogenase (short-subunit alcohol dehydrogenase family) [Micromonospora phaseoli]SEJ38870.1 NAD(P)-dependent dehydrogenase, short-chain alcohol dehydrogenase family [Micromonospora phaseoli]